MLLTAAHDDARNIMKNRNLRINTITPLLSPDMVMHKLPVSIDIAEHIENSRRQISHIVRGDDDRLLAIVGPCSIHDKSAALEYAHRLKALADHLAEELCIVMRVYFEKPRTTIGWKGLINDPHLDGSFAINDGLLLARDILLEINQIGLPTATEFVDTITPQYLGDLISWAAIGARTTESQPHRMLASGLSMPVGFKKQYGWQHNIGSERRCSSQKSAPVFEYHRTRHGRHCDYSGV